MATPPCLNPDCENKSRDETPGFCFTCSADLAYKERELEKEIDHVLRLEAEFVEWCAQNNKPHPHK